jgi:lipoprotein-releasing system permease protein
MTSIYFFIAKRFLFPYKNLRKSHFRIAIAGIAVGLLALISTLAVMDGLQAIYKQAILEFGSYHIRIHSHGFLDQNTLHSIQKIKYIRNLVPLLDTQVMVKGDKESTIIQVRSMEMKDFYNDKILQDTVNIIEGKFPSIGEISLGVEMADLLGYNIGDVISLMVIPQGGLQLVEQKFKITGLLKTGYYAYDRNMAMMSLSDGLKFLAVNKDLFYGVKVDHLINIPHVLKQIKSLDKKAYSWRSYNQVFLGALDMERGIMLLLLSLIFVIASLNIYQGRARELEEKKSEIVILRALGIEKNGIIIIWLWQGLLIGLVGVFLGLILGVIVTLSINHILAFIESFINIFIDGLAQLHIVYLQHIQIFSGDVYYLDSIPTQLHLGESLLLALVALLFSCGASIWASLKIKFLSPLEQLRND